MAVDVGQGITLDIGPALASLDKLGAAADAAAASVRQGQGQANAALAEGARAAQLFEGRLSSIVVETQRSAAAQQLYAQQIAGVVKEIRDQQAAESALRRAAAEGAAERRRANQELAAARKAEKQAAREVAEAEKQAAAAARLAAKEVANTAKEASKGQGVFAGLISKVTGTAPGGNIFSGLLTSATAATAGFFAFNEVSNRVKQGLADYGAIKGVQTTLKAVAGNASDGAREFQYIKEKSDELGLSLVPTAKAYTGLFAAAKEANLSVATTREVFEGVAGAAKVLSLSADDTNGVLLALQQIASKGTVASEELRGQIGERLPGAFGLAAKAMGLTTAELGKQLQAGKVLASDFLPKFAAQLKATYGDATADAATQVGSNLGRISTFFAKSSASIGEKFAPLVAAFAALVSSSKTTAQVATDSASAYFRQAEATKALTATVTPLLSRYEALSGITGRNTVQQKELDSIIQQLAKSVPGAVTQFDAYGKALGINSEAVRAFVRDQQKLVELNNAGALKDNRANLVALINEQTRLRKELGRTETDPTTGLKLRREEYKVGQGQAVPSLLSQAESDKLTTQYSDQLAKVQEDIRLNLLNRQALRGYNPLLPTDPTAAQLEGLVKKQEDIIKDLKERQKKATLQYADGTGADFLLGAGGLAEQLDKAEKELQRLLGKVDKSAKAAADRLAAALRALATAQENLRTKAAQAAIKDSQDEAERARLTFEEALRQSEKLKQAIIDREKKVAELALAKGGQKKVDKLGDKADGQTNAAQDAQLATINVGALDAYYAKLRAIAVKGEQQLFDLRRESDAKELEAINRRYNAERTALGSFQSAEFDDLDEAAGIRLAKRRELTANELAIEEARQRDLLALRFRQAEAASSQVANVATARVQEVGATFGEGTGISVIEAKRAEKQALLEIERKHAQDTLNNSLLLGTKEGELARAQAGARIAEVGAELRGIDQEKAKHKADDFVYKLLFGENDSDELRSQFAAVASQAIGAINDILSAQLAAEQAKIQAHQENIEGLQAQLAAEIQLNQEGSASNIKGIQESIAAEKAAKREAINEAKEIAKQQQAINDLQAISSISLAVANIIAGWSTIPLVGSILGIVAAGAMVASFVGTKAAASKAAQSQGYFTGGFTPDGGKYEEAGTVHKGEFVANQELTRDYRALFKNLHEGTPDKIDWATPQMQALLPDLELPGKMAAEKAAHYHFQQTANMEPVRAELAAVRAELAEIKASNGRMADKPETIPLGGGRYMERAENGSTKVVTVGG